jgi:hypothetical protein
MDVLKFTETVFTDKDKKGVLKPDGDGYYSIVLGALNTYNSANEYYTSEGVLELFESSSILMRRIKNGYLYAELGHPKKIPGMSMEDFYNRILTIEETNVCSHISSLTLDFNFGKKNPEFGNDKMIGIIGLVKPAGPKANALQLSLENPKQNTAFSIRALTENKHRNGRVERSLTSIITWDHITEPGISIACKAHSPGLEAYGFKGGVKELTDVLVDKPILRKALTSNTSITALEGNNELHKEILKSINSKNNNSRLSNW